MSNNKLALLQKRKELLEKEKIDTILKVSNITQEIAKIEEKIRMVNCEHENNSSRWIRNNSI